MKKKKLSYRFKILTVVIIALFLIGGCIVTTYEVGVKWQASILTMYETMQIKEGDRLVRYLKEGGATKPIEELDAYLITTLQEENQQDSACYWSLYQKDKVLYEKDMMHTSMLNGKDLEQVILFWQSKSGEANEASQALVEAKATSLRLYKEANMEELLVITPMQIQDKEYLVSHAATVTSILEMVNYRFYFSLLLIAYIAFCLVVVILLIVLIRKYRNIKALEAEMKEQSRTHQSDVVRLDLEVKERRKQVKELQVRDYGSGLYNREYFYTLLLNMSRQNLKALGMIVIEFSSTHKLIEQQGLEAESILLKEMRDIIIETLQEESLIARVDEHRIVITVLNDDYRRMSIECQQIEEQLNQQLHDITFTIYSIIQLQKETPMDMYFRIDRIISM